MIVAYLFVFVPRLCNKIDELFDYQMQQAEMEEMRQREANQTALMAIGPRKKRKGDTADSPGVSYNGAEFN